MVYQRALSLNTSVTRARAQSSGLSRVASCELTQWRECKARASRERGDLVRARAQRLSPSREWGLMLGRELGRDAARVGEGNTGIAGGGNLDAKCRALIETAGGPCVSGSLRGPSLSARRLPGAQARAAQETAEGSWTLFLGPSH
jgi:hypothetical protein